MKKIFLITFFALIFLLPLVSAQCLTVQLSKQSYLSGETFQAEISGDLQKDLTIDDINFYKQGKEYFPAFDFKKIASNKWIVWTKVPTNYGENKFSVTALCKEDILTEETKEVPYLIQRSFQDAYSWLKSEVTGQWNSLSLEEVALATQTLSFDRTTYLDGKSHLLSKSLTGECWPSAECNVKDTSLAFITFNGEEDIKNWLLDSENNVNIGLWDLIITSPTAQDCSLKINEDQQNLTFSSGINSPIALILPDDPEVIVSLNCSLTSAKVSHTYLGNVNEFPLTSEQGIFKVILNNNKCWGETYRSTCDAESTSYAIYALKQFDETLSEEISWLGSNIYSTIERAFYYSFTSDTTVEAWLINNQAPAGYWAENALALSDTPDLVSTALATKFISGTAKTKGEAWLESNFEEDGNFGDVKETIYALQVFTQDKVEPLISSIGFASIKSGQELTLRFSNNGILDVNLSVSLFGKTEKVNIPAFSDREVKFKASSYSKLTFVDADVSYSTSISQILRSYKLPVAVIPTGKDESLLEGSEAEGGTLFPAEFKFTPELINLTTTQKKISMTLNLESLSDDTLSVSITLFGISDIIDKIEPSSFDLLPGETKSINITFDLTRALGEYIGSINAETTGSSISLPVYSLVSGEVVEGTEEDEETEKDKEPFDTKKIGWGLIIIALLAVGSFFYFKLKKKPQAPIKLALEKIGRQIRE